MYKYNLFYLLAVIAFSLIYTSNYAQAQTVKNCPSDQNQDFNNCYGAYVFDNGDVYIGDWIDNNMDGQGMYIYTNGDKYEGGWTANEMSGYGIYTFANGSLEEGVYKNGELISETFVNDAIKAKRPREFKLLMERNIAENKKKKGGRRRKTRKKRKRRNKRKRRTRRKRRK